MFGQNGFFPTKSFYTILHYIIIEETVYDIAQKLTTQYLINLSDKCDSTGIVAHMIYIVKIILR